MALIDNIKAYWKFDEASGNAVDASGFGNTLINSGSTGYAAGVINNGIDFATRASTNVLYITGTGMAGLNAAVGNAYSVGVWIKPNTTPTVGNGVGRIVDIGGIGYITIEYNHNGSNVGLRVASGAGIGINYPITLTNGTLYHLIVTCGTDNVTRLYLNNVQVGSNGTNGGASSGINFSVGNANNSIGSNANSFGGVIDELYIAQQELDSSERTQLYNSGLGNQYPFFFITTNAVTNVSTTTATGNAEVLTDNGSTITERGVVWSTAPNPTTSNGKASTSGTLGAFSVSMTGLAVNTLYYVRSYFINSAGTTYGTEVTFTTLNINQYEIQKDINGSEGQTYIGQINVTGTIGTITVQLGTTGTSTVINAGAGPSTFSGTYSGLSGIIITRSADFDGTIDDVYYVPAPLGTTIDWSLDALTLVTPIDSSVFFKRIENDVFNSFAFYRYLDLLFKDLNANVTVTVRDEREDISTTRTKEFTVGNINPGEVSPFQKKRISFLIKNQAVIIGVSNANLDETFSIAEFVLTGHQKSKKMFSPSKIISLS